MDEAQCKKIQKIIDQQDESSRKVVLKQLSTVHADHSRRGLTSSGATLKAALDIFQEQASHFLASLVSHIAPMNLGEESFAMISAGVYQFRLFLEDELNRVAQATSDTIDNKVEAGGFTAAVANIWTEVCSNLASELEHHRTAFVVRTIEMPVENTRTVIDEDEAARTVAPFWHQMWADMAIELLSGDLQPNEEADIGSAMKEWFSSHQVEACEAEVLDCAHRLWLNYQPFNQQRSTEEPDQAEPSQGNVLAPAIEAWTTAEPDDDCESSADDNLFVSDDGVIRKERRTALRSRCNCHAQLRLPSGDRDGQLTNISASGASLQLNNPPRPGTTVLLTWKAHEIYCDVTWTRDNACGLKFEKPITHSVICETTGQDIEAVEFAADASNIPLGKKRTRTRLAH